MWHLHSLLQGTRVTYIIETFIRVSTSSWAIIFGSNCVTFLRVWGSFRCFFVNSKCVLFGFTEERIEFGHTAIKPKSVECCSDACTSVDFSYLHIWSWRSTRVNIGFFVTTLTKALLHQLLSLARRPALKRILVVSNFFHLRVTASVTLQLSRIFFWTLPQMCSLTQTCFWALQTVLLTPGLGFCSYMHYQLLDLLLRHACLSKSNPFNWICHCLPSLKV